MPVVRHARIAPSIGPEFGWSQVAGADGYRIYWGTSSGNYPSGPVEDTAPALRQPVSAFEMLANVRYYVVCRAYNASGESPNSNEISVINGVQQP